MIDRAGGPVQPRAAGGVYVGGGYAGPSPAATTAPEAAIVRPRVGGTVYGGSTGAPTSPNPEAPLELSGSLTGLILSRGHSAALHEQEQRSRLTKVLAIGGGGLIAVLIIGIIVASLAGDVIQALFRGITGQ